MIWARPGRSWRGYAARLALVVHCVRVAAGDPTLVDPDRVDEDSVASGIRLSRWFGNEARRIYAMLSEDARDGERRHLIEWIRVRGGTVTARELKQGQRRCKTADDSEKALDDLVNQGCGPLGGRPAGPEGRPPHPPIRPVYIVYCLRNP